MLYPYLIAEIIAQEDNKFLCYNELGDTMIQLKGKFRRTIFKSVTIMSLAYLRCVK